MWSKRCRLQLLPNMSQIYAKSDASLLFCLTALSGL